MERRSSRPSALVLAVLTAASALVALPTTAFAASTINYPNTERIEGTEPAAIAVNVSKRLFTNDGAQAVVLATKEKPADALTASAVAAEFGGPVLFTTSADLDTVTRNEIRRVLAPGKKVYIMGGEAAIARAVEDELDDLGYGTPRLAGVTRVETAAEAAFQVGAGPDRSAIIARAFDAPDKEVNTQSWVDSVSCGGYAAFRKIPILLTDQNRDAEDIPDATRAMLQRLGITNAFICGGTAAVPQAHADRLAEMGITVKRLAGETRVETAVAVAEDLWGYGTTDGKSFVVANGWGTNFAPGLAASQLSAREAAPIVLVNTTEPTSCAGGTISSETDCYLAQHNPSCAGVIVVGSTSLVSDAVFTAAAEACGLEEDNTPPSVPGNVNAADLGEDDGTNARVTWAASTDANGPPITYNLYFRNNGDGADLARANSARRTTDKLNLTLTGLTEGESYDVAVESVDQFGNRSNLSTVATVGPLVDEVPAAPTAAPNVTNVSGGMRVTWGAAPEADVASYTIYRAEAPPIGIPGIADRCSANAVSFTGGFASVGSVTGRTNTAFTDTTTTPGSEYCFRYEIFDTTENGSGVSPTAGPVLAEDIGDDVTPPNGVPTFYAVNHDQERGLIATSEAASRMGDASSKAVVIVPPGAYTANETGSVVLRFNGTERNSISFTATGNQQVVDVPFSTNQADWGTTFAVTALLEDAAGNNDPAQASAPWSLAINGATTAPPGFLPTPRIIRVADVDVDPATRTNQRARDVGTPSAPAVESAPEILVGGLGGNGNQVVTVYRNGVARVSVCLTPGQISGGTYLFNGDPGSPQVTMLAQVTNNLTVSTTPRTGNCPANQGTDQPAGRAGDSNTIAYFHDPNVFGISDIDPDDGSSDFRAYPTGVQLRVVFNNDADPTSYIRLVDPAGTIIKQVAEGSVDDTNVSPRIISFTATGPLAPGRYRVEVFGCPVGQCGVGKDVQRIGNDAPTFLSGFVHNVYTSTAVGAPAGETNDANRLTYVVMAGAPTGQYQVFSSGDAAPLATIVHTTGAESRSEPAAAARPDVFDGGAKTLQWVYQPPSGAATGNQDDGRIPLGPDVALLGVGVSGSALVGAAMEIDGAENLAARAYDFELYYRPVSGSNFQAPASLARQANGTKVDISSESARPGFTAAYYIKNVVNGNESVLVTDGELSGLSAVEVASTPGTPGTFNAGDQLVLTFNNTPGFSGPLLPGSASSTAGLVITDGDGSKVNPAFGAAGGATATTNGTDVIIVMGTASSIEGGPANIGPITVSGGTAWRALGWLKTGEGNAALLLVEPGLSSPPGTSF